jgi:hypothetical protein
LSSDPASLILNPKPRRPYTVSDRVLAANRLNIAKAVRAASDRWRLGSPTEAEKEAWRQNLLRARQVLHDDHTWKYAPCFRHGLTALSLERSLVLAGESSDEYHAHLARFDRLVRGLEPGPLSDPAKLARAAALASWRRLRALRLDREWTLRALVDALHQGIRARQQAQPAGHPPRLAADGLGLLPASALAGLSAALEAASSSWLCTWGPITRLNNRFDQLWSKLVEELGQLAPRLPSSFCWEIACMRPSPLVENYTLWPVEVLGNPLLPPSCILARLAERGLQVKAVAGWHCHPPFSSRLEADVYQVKQDAQRLQAWTEGLGEGRVLIAGEPDYRRLGQLRRAEAAARAAASNPAAEPERLPLPQSFEEFLQLVERAFGPEPPRRAGDATAPGEGPESGSASEAGPDAGRGLAEEIFAPSPGSEARSSLASLPYLPPEPPVGDAGRLRRLAELLWDRVERVGRRADREASRLAELVEAYGDLLGRPPQPAPAPALLETSAAPEASAPRLESSAPSGPDTPEATEASEAPDTPPALEQRDELATEVLEVFREKRSAILRSVTHERVIRLALYDLAVERFGPQAEFESLKEKDDRWEQLYHEFFQIFFGYMHRHRPDAGSG